MAVTKRRIKVKSNYSFSSRSKRLVFLLLPTRLSVFLFRCFIDDNRERNALEAAKFLVDANKIYATRYGRLIPKFLRFCLHLADLGLPKDYEKLVIESIWATHQNPKLRKQVNERLLQATSQLSQSDSTAQGWKLLTLALKGFGFMRAGKVSRTNCLHAALNEVTTKKASRRTIDLAIRGLTESRKFNDARILKVSLPTSHQETMRNDEVEIYINLLTNGKKLSTSTTKQELAFEVPGLRDLVEQKSVALVATGEINENFGREIDNHDIVARIKYQGDISTPSKDKTGKRCDLTFYTNDLVTKYSIKSENDPATIEFLDDLKLIITKEKSASTIGKTRLKVATVRAPTFLTTATSGTLFLFEIIRELPTRISLYGFNFYTSRQLYSKALLDSYKTTNALNEIGLPKNMFDLSSSQKSSANICVGFIAHDPLSDFLLIKNLYELSGLIDGTPEVLALLNLTADEYDLKLEEMLGDW
jgi:hypothetical protein